MRVLVTNDDGVEAPGLAALVDGLVAAGHDVVVAAPAVESSGSATGVGPVTVAPVRVDERTLPSAPGVPAFAVHAPPAFATLAACTGMFGDLPDVVVSGVNPGWNTGNGVMYSGTVGAALTAANLGRAALAVSCGPLPGARFDTAVAVAVRLLAAGAATEGTALNVNVPDVDLAVLRGAVEVPLGATSVHAVRMERAGGQIVVSERFRTRVRETGTDAAAVLAGHVALTRLLPGPRTAAPDGAAARAVETLLRGDGVAG